jgi:hypothetical protein
MEVKHFNYTLYTVKKAVSIFEAAFFLLCYFMGVMDKMEGFNFNTEVLPFL